MPKDLSVRIWGRTGCSEPKYFLNFTVFSCETGDCGRIKLSSNSFAELKCKNIKKL